MLWLNWFITDKASDTLKMSQESEAVVQHWCSAKLSNFHRKASMMNSILEKLQVHMSVTTLKGHHHQCFPVNRFCEYNFFGSFHSSIRSDIFYKVGLLKNFGKLTGKQLCQSYFSCKVAHHQACNFIKKRLQHRKHFVELLWWVLLI